MKDWCLMCHKITEFKEVSYPAPELGPGYSHCIPGLMHCSECRTVIFIAPDAEGDATENERTV